MHPFSYQNGSLHCESIEISKILREAESTQQNVCVNWDPQSFNSPPNTNSGTAPTGVSYTPPQTPLYVYSTQGLRSAATIYSKCSESLTSSLLPNIAASLKIGYALKANSNPHILNALHSSGVIKFAIAVSGYELIAAHRLFPPTSILLNGNGKQTWEVELAIRTGAMLNVDSLFDARQIAAAVERLKPEHIVRVLLRVRPDEQADLDVHSYVNTAQASKFGMDIHAELDEVLDELICSDYLQVVGLHWHLGSSMQNPQGYGWLGATITTAWEKLEQRGVKVEVLDIGGGIGVNYRERVPGYPAEALDCQGQATNISEFMVALANSIQVPQSRKGGCKLDIILEPGRHLVCKAGILVCKALGVKRLPNRSFFVVDGSMNEVIRPCLYGAYHQILPTSVKDRIEEWEKFDVVGPICESADFLGKGVRLPKGADYVAVMDVGAYCSSMASNYNLKPRAGEVLVDGETWRWIRRKDSFNDVVRNFYDF